MTRRVPYPMRSLLFVPGHNERYLRSAADSGADVLLPDLEDSVPLACKAQARDTVAQWMQSCAGRYVFPRVNGGPDVLSDVLALAKCGVDGFMLPKAYRGENVLLFDKLLKIAEVENGLAPGSLKIIPLIETTSAVLHVQEICEASPRVIAVAFGCEDFVADLHGVHDLEGKVLEVPRALIALGARAAGVIPIDTVHVKVNDLGDLERNACYARGLGFEGMLALHPKELPTIHKCFTPDAWEVERAREMLALAAEAEQSGRGVAIMEGRFIGPPMVRAAQQTLELAEVIERRGK